MQVPFVFGPGDLRLCETPAPIAGSADVLLRVGSVGVCGSDLGFVAAGGVVGPTATPIPIGHELSGTVIAAGKDVSGIAIGDRFVVNPLVNLIGNGGPEGGFAEQLLIREVASRPGSLIKLPDVLTLEQGALVEPLAVAAHAQNQLGVQPGHKVAVFGAGPIGLAAVVVLRARGGDDIVVFEPSAFRRERAERLGARHAIDPLERRPDEALRAVHGEVPLFRAKAPATTHFLEASGAPVIADIIALACVFRRSRPLIPTRSRPPYRFEVGLPKYRCGSRSQATRQPRTLPVPVRRQSPRQSPVALSPISALECGRAAKRKAVGAVDHGFEQFAQCSRQAQNSPR